MEDNRMEIMVQIQGTETYSVDVDSLEEGIKK